MNKLFLILLVAVSGSQGDEDQKNGTRNTRDSSWGESSLGSKDGGGGVATSYVYSNMGSAGSQGSGQGYSSYTGHGQGGSGGGGGKSWDSYGMKIGSDQKIGGQSIKVIQVGGGDGSSGGNHQEASTGGHAVESFSAAGSDFGSSGSGGHGFSFGGFSSGGGYDLGGGSGGQSYEGSGLKVEIIGQGQSSGGDYGVDMGSLGGHGGGSSGHGYEMVDFKGFEGSDTGANEHHNLMLNFGHLLGGGGGFGHGHLMARVPLFLQHQPQVHETTKAIPVHQDLKIPVPHPVKHSFFIPLPVKVPEPFLIKIPVPYPIEKTVEVAVEKKIPYPIEKPVPYKVVKKVHVPVYKPVPIPVPVYKTKYVHHTKKIYEGHEHH